MSNLVIAGNTYLDVPSIVVPKEGGGYATYSEGGGGTVNLKMGAIRPDAELVQSFSFDELLVADDGITIPSYSTSTTTLKASQTAGTVHTPIGSYDYFCLDRCLVIPIYNISTTGKGREEYCFYSSIAELTYYDHLNALVDPSKEGGSGYAALASNVITRMAYWHTATNFTVYTSSTTYGAWGARTAPTYGGSTSTITVKTPAITIRGNSTYFAQTYYDAITDIRVQWVFEVYRSKNDALNINGWSISSQAEHIINCVNSASHTLT